MKDFLKKILFSGLVMVFLYSPYLYANTLAMSIGDTLLLSHNPYDSEATIRGNLEALQRDWELKRLWWRGQPKYFFEFADIVQDETLLQFHIWQWWLEHNESSTKTIQTCLELGIEPWFWTGLFEFGASKDIGGNGALPNVFESKLRKKHPEWIPVNKYGTRRQGGPIDFCYPEARVAYIKNLKSHLLKESYQGIIFYTYAENFGTRYLDEFGYNQPIVDEFMKRYGVNILTESFDKELWAQLRAEYVTAFLRELKTALNPHGIKIGVQLSAQMLDGNPPRPDMPTLWPGVWSKLNKMRIGRIYMDWRQWVDEGSVDELNVWYPGSKEVAIEIRDYCKKNNPDVLVSMYLASAAHKDYPEGVKAISCLPGGIPEAIQSGFPMNQIKSPVNNFDDPAKTLKLGNKFQKRQLLYLANKNIISLSLKDMKVAATKDKDVFVRAMAVRALRESGLSKAISVIEDTLNDSEHYIRCLSATELGKTPGPTTLQKMFDVIAAKGSCQYNLFVLPGVVSKIKSTGNFGMAQKLLIQNYLSHSNSEVRQTMVYIISAVLDSSDFKDELFHIAAHDSDRFAKTLALYNISKNFGDEETYEIIADSIKGSDQIIQVRAAEAAIFSMQRKGWMEKHEKDMLNLLLKRFKEYCSDGKRTDDEWGWRLFGSAICSIGSEGKEALETLMEETKDPRLADLAWRILYVRQSDGNYVLATEQEDAIAHEKRPLGNECRQPVSKTSNRFPTHF